MSDSGSHSQVLHIAKSPLLQGAALNSMLEFFKSLVQANLPGLSFHELLNMLISPVLTGNLLNIMG